jgi:hypothetical protein
LLTLARTPQEIAAALQECDNDVEATIRRLDELSLAAAARAGEPGSLPPLADNGAHRARAAHTARVHTCCPTCCGAAQCLCLAL